jgi:hypothetical protein
MNIRIQNDFVAARGTLFLGKALNDGSLVAGCYAGCYVRITVSGEFFRPYAGE